MFALKTRPETLGDIERICCVEVLGPYLETFCPAGTFLHPPGYGRAGGTPEVIEGQRLFKKQLPVCEAGTCANGKRSQRGLKKQIEEDGWWAGAGRVDENSSSPFDVGLG